MNDIEQIGKNTYYIKNATNIGIYKIDDNHVWIIDSGNDKEAGKKILKIIAEKGWTIVGIINTHSNADHIGGNKIIQDRSNCQILSSDFEGAFIKHPILESSFLYGGFPFKDLQNKFLMAQISNCDNNIANSIPKELEIISLKGHFFDMIGIKTPDDIYFLADALFSKEIIEKYHIFFIYDVKEFLSTLDFIENLNGKLFIPSHGQATEDIKDLVTINRNKVIEIINLITNFCEKPITFEELLKNIFDKYNLIMNSTQYVLIGSTIKSYLSYLYNNAILINYFDNNRMYWHIKEENN